MVPLLIVVALLVPPLLAYIGVIGLVVMFVADIGILMVAAWGIDRRRAPGARDPFLDANRADYASPIAMMIPPLPAEAFEDPEDRPGAVR